LVHNADSSFDLTLQGTGSVLHFDPTGTLTSATDDYGNALVYTYAAGRLQRVADSAGSGRYLDIFWGPDGRVSSVQDSTGRIVQYTYTPQGALQTVTDPASRVTTYSYFTGRFSPLLSQIKDYWNRVVTSVTYDPRDRVLTYTEKGETYTYTYNYNNVPTTTAKTDSAGNVWVYPFGQAGLVTDSTPPVGAGGTTHTDYYPDGTLQQLVDPVGVRTYYTYTLDGRPLTITRDYLGPAAVRYDYTYDSHFPRKVTSITPRNPTTNALDLTWQAWQYDYYQAGDPAPGALHHVYRVRNDGATLDTLATYTYNNRGQVTQQIGASGGTTDYVYDATANLYTVTDPPNNDAGTRPVTTYGYDALGRVTAVTDALGHTATFGYDAVDRVTSSTLPKPSSISSLVFTTTYSYDLFDSPTGLVFVTMTDPNGVVSKQGFNQDGQLVRTVDGLNSTTVYSYTHALLASITDANANTTSYGYDGARRMTAVTFPDNAVERYVYTADNLLYQRTDRKGQTITYAYDHFKRVSQKTYPGTGIATTYSFQGQLLAQVVDSSVTPTETHTFAYESSYRLQSETQATRGTITRTYNPDDSVSTMTVQSGPATVYTYYPDGSLDTLQWSPAAGSFKYTYTLGGRYASLAFPSGQSRNFSYDDQGRLLQLSNLAAGGANLATYAYGYDYNYTTGLYTRLGQRTSLAATVPSQGFVNQLFKYEYDALYQSNKVTYPGAAPFNAEIDSWTYDLIGNRSTSTINASTQTYIYQKAGANPNNWQRLTNDGTNGYTYDANGSLITRSGPGGNVTFGWNVDNRLVSLTGAATASYAYDFEGRRASRTAGSTTTYLYAGSNLIQESGASTADYVFGAGLDEPLAMSRGGHVYYYATDALGSATVLADSGGVVQDSYTLDGWGQTRTQTGSLVNPFGYTGREPSDAGLVFYRARSYSPAIGRFTSQDPLSDASGVSAYAYAANAPAQRTDPLGLFSVVDRITKLKSLNIDASCGVISGGACTRGGRAQLNCDCKGCGDSWHADTTLTISGTLYYYSGPFRQLNRRPVDTTVVDAASAIAHEYNAHINRAVEAVRPLAESYEAMPFRDEQLCSEMCGVVAAEVVPLFSRVLGMTQADEQGNPYRPRI
jgi:RHS repeat-associated protein